MTYWAHKTDRAVIKEYLEGKLFLIGLWLIALILLFVGIFLLKTNLAHAETKKEFKPRYGFTYEERALLAKMLSGDFRKDGDGEYDIDFNHSFDRREAYKVLCVVMNRQRHPKFPNKVKDILLAKGQFHVFPRNLKALVGIKTWNVVYWWCRAYDEGRTDIQVIPEDHLYFSGTGIRNKTRRGGIKK